MSDSLQETLKEHDPAGIAAAAEHAAAGVAARAEEAGVLDVAYTRVDSPFGPLLVAATKRGLVKVAWSWNPVDEVVEGLARKLSPRVLESAARLDPVRRQLEDYFEHRRTEFDLPIDWSLTRGFTRRVLQATNAVPYGELATYTEVATRAGSPRGVRAAGNALGANPIPVVVPCHRIVRSGGALGGYGGGLDRKRALLRIEGNPFD